MALIASIVFTNENLEVFAKESGSTIEQNNAKDDDEFIDVNSNDDETIVSEIISSRDEYSKEYLLSDGSRALVVYAQPVHYVAENGAMIEIDNSLVETEEGYENAENNYKVLFTDSEESKGQVVFEADDYQINWEYVDAPENAENNHTDLKVEKEDSEENLEDLATYGHVISSSNISFEGYADGTKLEYEPLSDGVKESIIVDNREIGNNFTFKINLNGLKARINLANEVELYDEESGDTKYIFPAPFMEDANGEYSDAVWYSFGNEKEFEDVKENIKEDSEEIEEKKVSETDEESKIDKDSKEVKESKEVKDSKDVKDSKGAKETKDINESKDAKESEEVKKSKDIKDRDSSEVEEDTLKDDVEKVEGEKTDFSEKASEEESEGDSETEEKLEDELDSDEENDEELASEKSSEEKLEESSDDEDDVRKEDEEEVDEEKEEDEDYIYLTVTADEKWLASASFPVVIDPIIKPVVEMKNVDTCCVSSTSALISDTLLAGKSVKDNCLYRSFVRFNLPELKANKIISSAELNVTSKNVETPGKDGCEYLVIRKITSPWQFKNVEDKTISSWATQPTFDDRNIDYIKVGHKFFDITKTVREWYEGISPNYGLAIMSYDEARKGVGNVALSTAKATPYLKITYRDSVGIEDYWGTHQTAVGTAGEGYINDYTGALTVVNNDVSTNGLRKNLNIQHVYNSNADSNQKWKLNYEERITVPLDELDITAYPYVYTDGDGTKHYFKAENVSYLQNGGAVTAKTNNPYPSARDEDGLKLYIVQVTDNVLKNKYPIKLIDKSSTTVKYFDRNGRLALITDSNQYENGKSPDVKNPTEANRVEVSYQAGDVTYGKENYDIAIEKATLLKEYANKQITTKRDELEKKNNYNALTTALDELSTDIYAQTDYRVAKNVMLAQNAYNAIEDINTVPLKTLAANMTTIINKITDAKKVIGDTVLQDGYISQIKDAVGRVSLFEYDDAHRIVSISDPSTENGKNYYKYDDFGQLTDVIFSNGKTAKYIYGEDGKLIIMRDDSGYEVIYTYDGNRVSQVQEWTNEAQGQTYTIEYGINNINTFRFSGIDDVYGNGDDVINTYVFDSQGRKISEYSNIVDKNEVLGAQAYTYADNVGKAVARTTYNDQSASSSQNYLANGGFEDGLGRWNIPRGYENNVGDTSKISYLGSRCGTLMPKGGTAEFYQSVRLSKGTYVVSYRVKNEGSNAVGVFVNYDGSPKEITKYAVKDGDWSFQYGSFTLNQDSDVPLYVFATGSGTSYIDAMVLESGSAPTGYVSSTSTGEKTAANKDDSNTRHKIKDYAVKGRQTFNILKNHDFEFNDDSWTPYITDNTAITNRVNKFGATNPYIGAKCAVFTMQNLKSKTAGIKQNVETLAPGVYTLSAYVKANNITDTKVFLKVTDKDGNTYKSETINESNIKSIDEGWRRLKVIFKLKEESSIEVAAEVEGGTNVGKGIISCDSFQLETGDVANQYNILEDGNFELTKTDTPYKWSNYIKGVYRDEIISAGVNGGKCYHITGEPGRNKFLKFATNLGAGAESYVLSGWIKTNTTPIRNGRSLKVRAYHADANAVFESTLGLDDYSEGWKYFTLILPNHKWGQTEIAIQFYDNIGDLYIDDLQLSRNEVCTNEYNTSGTKKAVNQGKKQTQQTYDAYNRVNAVISPSGAKQTIAYNKTNQVSTVSSNCGPNRTVMTYDKYGNQLTLEERSVATAEGEKTLALYAKNAYTDDGNYLSSTTSNNGATTHYEYDNNSGLKISETLPAFDGDDNGKIKYTYDENDHLSKVNRSLGAVNRDVKYTYGSLSDLQSIEHNGFKYEYQYDAFGNVLSTSIAGQVTQSNVYNAYNGSLKETHFADDSVQYTDYDEYGNIIALKTATADGEKHITKSYKYDNDGNVAEEKDELNDITTEYDYNASKDVVRTRVKGKVNGINYSSINQFTYNTAGSVEEATYILNGKAQSYKYTYQTDGKENVVTFPSGSSKTNAYDKLRRSKKITYKPVKNAAAARQHSINYTYTNGIASNKGYIGTQNKVSRYANNIGNTTVSGFDYTYDASGNILTIRNANKVLNAKELANAKNNRTYEYNAFGEIENATETYENGETKEYSYKYDKGGNIVSETVVNEDGIKKTNSFVYDEIWKDKLVSYNGHSIEYDVMGHPTKYLGKDMKWNSINNALVSVSGKGRDVTYGYLSDGQRLSKKVGEDTTTYIYNSGKLLAEETNVDRINYYYDSEGTVIEIGYQKKADGELSTETRYFFTKNAQGDIVGVYRCSDSVLVGNYEYDLWGNIVSITENNAPKVNVTADTFILNRNPLRYRGYYYDSETGFYYLNARYYDPKVHRFISADSQIAGVSEDVNGYNLFAYCNNNPVNCQDQSGEWPQLTNTQKVVIGLGLITALAVVTVATAGTGTVLACAAMGALEGAATGAVTGAASGALISGGITYLTTGDIQATKKAAIDGAADGFMWGSIGGAVTGGMNSPHCFAAGTLVCTVDGEVPIEDIEVGDYVLAENPETGEIDYKPVLETYEHDTYDVVYLTIDGEEFTTTEGHPFYTLERGFVKAGELRFSDTLIDDDGNKLHLDKKNKEHLVNPVTVYNFAVEDYHTYFVGENEVLVHNNCGMSELAGKADTRVYYGIKDGEKVYVGITKDIARRQAQHGARFDKLVEITKSPLSRREARAIEQVLIEQNPGFLNKINSISSSRSWYNEAIKWGSKWLGTH